MTTPDETIPNQVAEVCPACRHSLEGISPTAVCPECGGDRHVIMAEMRRWRQGARRWVAVGSCLLVFCILGTIAGGYPPTILCGVLVELICGGPALGVLWLRVFERVDGSAAISAGTLTRALVPLALMPVYVAMVFSWFMPLTGGMAARSANIREVNTFLEITSGAGIITAAGLVVLSVARGAGRCAPGHRMGFVFGAVCPLIAAGALSCVVTIIAMFMMVGGDGMGP